MPNILTEDQIEEYYREGFLVVRGLVPLESIEKVRAEAMPSISAEGQWSARIFEHEDPDKDPKTHRLLVEQNIISAVEDLFEVPARVYYGMLAVVTARGGNGLPWHQDNQYSHLLGRALNVFIALCDITPEKANLWVSPGSHLLGVQPSEANTTTAPGHRETTYEPANGTPLPTLYKGDVCIFDRYTLHRSLKNDTDEDRWAYAAQYQADYVRQGWTGKKDPLRMRATDLRARWQEAGFID